MNKYLGERDSCLLLLNEMRALKKTLGNIPITYLAYFFGGSTPISGPENHLNELNNLLGICLNELEHSLKSNPE